MDLLSKIRVTMRNPLETNPISMSTNKLSPCQNLLRTTRDPPKNWKLSCFLMLVSTNLVNQGKRSLHSNSSSTIWCDKMLRNKPIHPSLNLRIRKVRKDNLALQSEGNWNFLETSRSRLPKSFLLRTYTQTISRWWEKVTMGLTARGFSETRQLIWTRHSSLKVSQCLTIGIQTNSPTRE